MDRILKVLFGAAIGVTPILLFGLLFVGFWHYTDPTGSSILVYLIAGIVAGLAVDGILLQKYSKRIYEMPIWILIVAYLLLNIGVFGLFMGFPVFNLFCGLLAGIYYGKRIALKKIYTSIRSKSIRQLSWLTTSFMLLICCSSAIIAMSDPYIRGNVKGVMGLDAEPSQAMIWALILVGGSCLVVTQYFVTRLSAAKMVKL
ncbi:hypothetical protein [uncultured Acetobacteroides sp.]|uniref:hypothetical protein n=1 Tax=uncultured Acetobacteroides sp. TaxID=1760811 RepID=UPI0029F5C8DD|nr:hypothetical protein [uncultured Acetobacteroides sp.]